MLWSQQTLNSIVCMMGMGHQLSAGPCVKQHTCSGHNKHALATTKSQTECVHDGHGPALGMFVVARACVLLNTPKENINVSLV
jgi:hypothetical protein